MGVLVIIISVGAIYFSHNFEVKVIKISSNHGRVELFGLTNLYGTNLIILTEQEINKIVFESNPSVKHII
ncbi:MAG: hypothetical protein WCO06_04225, partial [Candidatus Roizmanbacteria bacterium]